LCSNRPAINTAGDASSWVIALLGSLPMIILNAITLLLAGSVLVLKIKNH